MVYQECAMISLQAHNLSQSQDILHRSISSEFNSHNEILYQWVDLKLPACNCNKEFYLLSICTFVSEIGLCLKLRLLISIPDVLAS